MTFFIATAAHTQPGDADLVTGALTGDARAFRSLMQKHLSAVYNYLYRMTQSHEISEEITQETFMKAYRNLKHFDRTRQFRPWVLRIASNSALSALRKKGREVSLNALEEDGSWSEADHQSAEDDITRLERQGSWEDALKALDRLDEKYRQVLVLRYQNDLSYEEIALTLDIPLNTVRTRIRRGLEKLKQEIKENAPND